MGIDIYARWEGQTEEEKAAQQTGFTDFAGRYGHLREGHLALPSVIRYLVHEAFAEEQHGTMIESGVSIPATTLRRRLPQSLHLMEQQLGDFYVNGTQEAVQPYFNDIIAFVALCERMEKKTGQPVNILAAI
jgi:hypothetical protein